MKKNILILVTLFIVVLTNISLCSDYENHWAKEAIELLKEKEIVQGDETGNINPDANITRAEFVKIVNKAMNYATKGNEQYNDISGDEWYAEEFLIAKKIGYVQGDENGNANPNTNITRAEACVILARIFNIDNEKKLNFFDEEAIPSWAYTSIAGLIEKEIIKGYDGNVFNANNNITRAESFTLINKVNQMKENGEIKDIVSDNLVIATGKDIYGNTVSFYVVKKDNKYYLSNNRTEIRIALNMDEVKDEKTYPITTLDNKWEGNLNSYIDFYGDRLASNAITVYMNEKKVYDFYKNVLNTEYDFEYKIYMTCDKNDPGQASAYTWVIDPCINVSYYENNDATVDSVGAYLDILAHEITHMVHFKTSSYENVSQSGAIVEGYADIMGELIEIYYGIDDSWIHGNTRGEMRSMINPNDTSNPAKIGDAYYWDPNFLLDEGGIHRNSTIISHVAYLMYKNGINDIERLARLWYGSIKYMNGYSTFGECRYAILESAKELKMTNKEIEIIKNAFNEVGIINETGEGYTVIINNVEYSNLNIIKVDDIILEHENIRLHYNGDKIVKGWYIISNNEEIIEIGDDKKEEVVIDTYINPEYIFENNLVKIRLVLIDNSGIEKIEDINIFFKTVEDGIAMILSGKEYEATEENPIYTGAIFDGIVLENRTNKNIEKWEIMNEVTGKYELCKEGTNNKQEIFTVMDNYEEVENNKYKLTIRATYTDGTEEIKEIYLKVLHITNIANNDIVSANEDLKIKWSGEAGKEYYIRMVKLSEAGDEYNTEIEPGKIVTGSEYIVSAEKLEKNCKYRIALKESNAQYYHIIVVSTMEVNKTTIENYNEIKTHTAGEELKLKLSGKEAGDMYQVILYDTEGRLMWVQNSAEDEMIIMTAEEAVRGQYKIGVSISRQGISSEKEMFDITIK